MQLNNAGVACLDSGKTLQALNLFREALTHTMVQLRKPDSLPGSLHATNTCQSTSESLPFESTLTPDFMSLFPGICEGSQNWVPFIHARAMRIIANHGAYAKDPMVNATLNSAIIIFNLAVVYHVKAVGESVSQGPRLCKAKSLYEKSYLLLADCNVLACAGGNPTIDLLSMALLNNLAQITYELTEYDSSQLYFQELVRFAHSVSPDAYGNCSIATFMDYQKSSFLLNAMFLHAPSIAPAA